MSVNPIIFSPIGRTKAFNFNNTLYSYAFDEATGRTFVSGNFTTLEGQSRAYIGAYDANGTLSSWYPTINGVAYVMIVDGSTLYIGGAFTLVNGITRKGFAALSTTSGLEAPTIAGSVNVTVSALGVTSAVQSATVSTASNANITATALTTTVAVQTPTLSGSVGVTANALTNTTAIQAPTVTGASNLTATNLSTQQIAVAARLSWTEAQA
jgi:hypothetical protein